MYKPFLIRMAVTSAFLGASRYYGAGTGFLFVATFFLDAIDERLASDGDDTHEHKRHDKVADLLTYCMILAGFAHQYDAATLVLLSAALAWRAAGVAEYFRRDDDAVLATHVDAVSGIMAAHSASKYLGQGGAYPVLVLLLLPSLMAAAKVKPLIGL